MAEQAVDFDSDSFLGTLNLAQASRGAIQWMHVNPKDALKEWGEAAKSVAIRDAEREVHGRGKASESGSEHENWEYRGQAVALARQLMALAHAGSAEAIGPLLGEFKALCVALDDEGKALVLADAGSMMDSASWSEQLAELAESIGYDRPPEEAFPTGEPLPEESPSEFEIEMAREISSAQADAAALAVNAAGVANGSSPDREALGREMAAAGLAEMVGAVAKIKMRTAAREADTGIAWRGQEFTRRFSKSIDIEMSALAMTMVGLARHAGVDPESDPKLRSSMRALFTVMGKGEAIGMASWLAGKAGGPDLGPQWKAFAEELGQSAAWTVGVAAPANGSPARKPAPSAVRQLAEEPEAPAPAGRREPTLDAEAPAPQWSRMRLGAIEEPQAAPGRAAALAAAANSAGRKLRGFVDSFAAPQDAAWLEPSEPPASEATAPAPAPSAAKEKIKELLARGAASLGQGLAKIEEGGAKLEGKVAALIDKANAATDAVEARVKQGLREAGPAIGRVLDEAVASGAAFAKGRRDAFKGKVGEAKASALASIGGVALKAHAALPDSIKSEPAGAGPRQVALMQVAAFSGALLVGVSMAPVAGLAIATVGALAAGAGFASAIKKASAAFSSAARLLPPALESIGARLGAKRAERAEPALDKVEPQFGPMG